MMVVVVVVVVMMVISVRVGKSMPWVGALKSIEFTIVDKTLPFFFTASGYTLVQYKWRACTWTAFALLRDIHLYNTNGVRARGRHR
jgi:hypothetical protein